MLGRIFWLGQIVFSTLAVDLDCIRVQKLKSQRVIVFQTGILQRVRLVTGAQNIHAQIDARL